MDAGADPIYRWAPQSEAQPCNLNFLARQKNVHLRHLEVSEPPLSRLELWATYLVVLGRGESLARYLGVPLLSDFVEEKFNKLFSTCSPPLAETDNAQGSNMLSWVDVIREFESDQVEYTDDGTCRFPIQGLLVQISETDYTIMQSGILQKLLNLWPDPRDVQEELETVELAIAEVSEWNQYALQGRTVTPFNKTTNCFIP
ncbi:uncharacterized protein ASPGLDRAFT_58638 [Aspergillus glaucus CBS 516.65]|uniref:Uncharacterized protein n=1 Tax=Aspergillus glaucus CBS 516.65 TaxID=1160497 RepID=A0A1L9VHZ3_ASPGL|nr:hypothetical protein ASPGLDRAFT_58638 [Aspergillus glaucus CBS 516.65]OJJ83547.1 hypothetical protein ASPGLDRAFT_58638 [Aspergillus glaucus CBS 516.65]